MTRDDLINFLNQQTGAAHLREGGALTLAAATKINFDDLAGDSLEALQLVMAVEEHLGIEIEIHDLQRCGSLLEAIDLMISRAKQGSDVLVQKPAL